MRLKSNCLVHALKILFGAKSRGFVFETHCCYSFACVRNSLPLTPTWRNIYVYMDIFFLWSKFSNIFQIPCCFMFFSSQSTKSRASPFMGGRFTLGNWVIQP